MPTERISTPVCEQPLNPEHYLAGQTKLCISCNCALEASIPSLYLSGVDTAVCTLCARVTDRRGLCAEIDREPHHTRPTDALRFQDVGTLLVPPVPSQVIPTYTRSNIASIPKQHRSFQIDATSLTHNDHPQSQPAHVSIPPPNNHRQLSSSSHPEPLLDITRLRVRTQRYQCIYPGATFQGLQKSGRNSYDVSVTIQDVDFSSSFLCGYLRINGLTEDWPVLTTYFDAEIIGPHHGFLTQKWGADDDNDLLHWSRFPAFRHVKNDLRKPRLTMEGRDRGAVFMRWKERFLVPDHRVSDINGASFAGIYYVCVDFNPSPPSSASPSQTRSSDTHMSDLTDADCLEGCSSQARQTATLSGYYWHTASEPYQQLLLNHIPERTTSSFEFR